MINMKVYGKLDSNEQTIIYDGAEYTPKENEILMNSKRPDEGEWIAGENGEWVIDKESALKELDAQYNQDKAALVNAYTDSIMNNDTETAEAIKAELAALNEKYDADYQAIMNGEGK